MDRTNYLHAGLIAYGLDRPLTGITRYTVELIQALTVLETSPDLTLLTAGKLQALDNPTHYSQIPLCGSRLLPGLLTLGAWSIARISQKRTFDVVHDPTGVTPLVFGTACARSIVTVHDVFPWAFPGTNTLLDTLIYRYWLPRRLPLVDAVITDSYASKADIARYLHVDQSKIHVVPLAVPQRFQRTTDDQIERVLARHKLPRRYILSVGSQNKRRNLLRLLKAYALLRDDGETPPLVIVGSHQQMQGINETIQSLRLENQVIFPERVSDSDLSALYSGTELFVFPSLYEGFGLTPLEAMACGASVVCSNNTALPEVVGDAALTVDPYNEQAIANGMKRVLTDKALAAELREKGFLRTKQFTWTRTASQTFEVYRSVIGN